MVAATAVALGGFALAGGVIATTAGAGVPPAGCPPTLSSVAVPNHVVESGGIVPVLLKGQCLNHVSAVAFGADAAASFKIESQSAILATPAAEAAGTVNITVTSPPGVAGPGGTSPVAPGVTYTYYAPTIRHITPASGPIAGGTIVIIKGAAVSEPGKTPVVVFGGTPATHVKVLSSESAIQVVTPAHNAPKATGGVVPLTVTTTAGTGSTTFKYLYTTKK